VYIYNVPWLLALSHSHRSLRSLLGLLELLLLLSQLLELTLLLVESLFLLEVHLVDEKLVPGPLPRVEQLSCLPHGLVTLSGLLYNGHQHPLLLLSELSVSLHLCTHLGRHLRKELLLGRDCELE
jgi:hypothetical protein